MNESFTVVQTDSPLQNTVLRSFFIYLSQEGYVFICVCLSLSVYYGLNF